MVEVRVSFPLDDNEIERIFNALRLRHDTHFLQPNHSSRFYDELAKVYPNWKECRKKLRDINIR